MSSRAAVPFETDELGQELAQLAARHIAEEGLSYGQAKRKAAKQAGIAPHHAAMPSNPVIEQALREYQAAYLADTQPAELAALRGIALKWMATLAALDGMSEPVRTLAAGAVVNGTAGEHSPVHLQVFLDESKHFEIALINSGHPAGQAMQYSDTVLDGLNCPVLVLHDRGVPIVLTLLPAKRYKLPQMKPDHSPFDHPQLANAAQLQLMMQTKPQTH